MQKQVILSIIVFLFLLVGTTVAILYGKGYRFGFEKGKVELSGTGLLVATSTPDGAQVFINDHLTTATDNTINLAPGTYQVKIFKDGYFPWEKTIKVQKEVVSKADALLLPKAPKLESLTITGVENPVMDPSMTKIAYTIASQSAAKNGAYILDLNARTVLALQSASTQIANDTLDYFSQSLLSWSPDGREILATVSAEFNPITPTYLLQTNGLNQSPLNVSGTLLSIQNIWDEEADEKQRARLNTLKKPLREEIRKNFSIISWAPDESKILYQASRSATLPFIIKPRLIDADLIPEQRDIKQGSIYVYDIKDDKNYFLTDKPVSLSKNSQNSIKWFPDSAHLIWIHDRKIDIVEADGSNATTVYAGPFTDNYVFPFTNGSKIVILTNLGNPTITPNLYTIDLE